MKRFVAFLRGINISGKNKISMCELKSVFEQLGFADVKTYLNSGNVAFSSNQNEKEIIACRLEQMISEVFNYAISVFVISKEELEDVLRHAPEWWGNDNNEVYDNLIFIIRPATYQQVYDEIGSPKEDLEKISDYKEAVFWSFIRKEYQKTNWWKKTADANIGSKLTIRTAGTVRKICSM